MRPSKPAYGAPCNNCGQCCEDQLCPLGQIHFKRLHGPCPALGFVGDVSSCGLVADPRRFAPVKTAVRGVSSMRDGAILLIGAGHGCDARLEHEPEDEAARRRMIAAVEQRSAAERFAARKSWGIE